jgi:SAM-dependent methyltransferase
VVTDDREINQANWDDRVPAHLASDYYNVRRFLGESDFISDVVRFDLPRLGDVRGLLGVHLQCHIGTDTISLARLGASMTGLDFSGKAVEAARKLASGASADATFVQSDVYRAAAVLGAGEFDLVYTGVGSLSWLPDIRRWGYVVADLLRPGGRLFIREDHPMLLSAKARDGLLTLERPYFEQSEPNVSTSGTTYVGTDATIRHAVAQWWNHGIGEIMTALLGAGLRIVEFTEHDSVPWPALPGAMEHIGDGEYRLIDRPQRLPHSYTLQAAKAGLCQHHRLARPPEPSRRADGNVDRVVGCWTSGAERGASRSCWPRQAAR